MTNSSGSKSTLFLMEQLIVILIFSFCAAICVKIFVVSFMVVSDVNDTTNALRIAQNGAECYKAVSGDAEYAASILNGGVSVSKDDSGNSVVYYNENWAACEKAEAVYILKFTEDKGKYAEESVSETLLFNNISVEKITGEEITALTVAAIGKGIGGTGK